MVVGANVKTTCMIERCRRLKCAQRHFLLINDEAQIMNGDLMNVYPDRQLNPLHGCAVGIRFIFGRRQ